MVRFFDARYRWIMTKLPTIKMKKAVTAEAARKTRLESIHASLVDSSVNVYRRYRNAQTASISCDTRN